MTIKDLKNEGLKKIFVGGMSRRYDPIEEENGMACKAVEVFKAICEQVRELESYEHFDMMDTEMVMDAIMDQMDQCIPSDDYAELNELRLNGWGLDQ